MNSAASSATPSRRGPACNRVMGPPLDWRPPEGEASPLETMERASSRELVMVRLLFRVRLAATVRPRRARRQGRKLDRSLQTRIIAADVTDGQGGRARVYLLQRSGGGVCLEPRNHERPKGPLPETPERAFCFFGSGGQRR